MTTATRLLKLPFFEAVNEAHHLKTWSLLCDGKEEIHFRDGSAISAILDTEEMEVLS